jgi:hypothetical protein
MFLRNISAILLGSALIGAPVATKAADRGPSTPEERKQALEYIRHFEADPLNPALQPEKEWLTIWMIQVPDLHVKVCTILDKLPKGDKKDGQALFNGMFFSQIKYVIENPGKQNEDLAQLQAGVEGLLRVYELLLQTKPKDREPYLDDLIQRRNAGTLAEFVKERAATACKN